MKKNLTIKIFGKRDILTTTFFLRGILFLEKKCFPRSWQYGDSVAKRYYLEKLKNFENDINVFVIYNGKIVGYLLGSLFNRDTYNELRKSDKKIKFIKDCLYVDTVGILPSFRGGGVLKKIFFKLIVSARSRGYKNVCIHARKSNFLDVKVSGIFIDKKCSVIQSRNINKWPWGGNEPYKYLLFRL